MHPAPHRAARFVLLVLLASRLPGSWALVRVRRDEPYVFYLVVASAIIILLSVIYFCLACRRPVDRNDIEYGEVRRRKKQGGIAYPQVKKVPSGTIPTADGSRVSLISQGQHSATAPPSLYNGTDDGHGGGQWTGRAHNSVRSVSSGLPSAASSHAPPAQQGEPAETASSLAPSSRHEAIDSLSSAAMKTGQDEQLQVPPAAKLRPG
ncbi:hypothetical protein SYNPS1DRAFT_22462 [Syncephalis pseudoplumigaleata]|uniref:Uncharacterized protein n=1 Tax=Syncephalis pseudoplumigaleata TaxID=1712513 RepID=A0A4P9YZK8_9FUNG|nr:hypothetical protein SYNPS1DRAFT_22462 [Syncephalis pseudoplumigaleata]|eukprot:RKP25607.1 hypothetical protein SYNPS1DRAFT_22462 [Syncephalis pseudoplumigaleata]